MNIVVKQLSELSGDKFFYFMRQFVAQITPIHWKGHWDKQNIYISSGVEKKCGVQKRESVAVPNVIVISVWRLNVGPR